MPGKVWLGCSGWSYKSWRPDFYPAKTPLKKLLTAYAERLNTVEVNYTFRQLPTPAIVQGWLAQAPAPFHFAFKAPQAITHFRRLVNAGELVRAFAASLAPVEHAGQLGPVLFQLPPNFRADPDKLAAFLGELHGTGLKSAWEFRHESWFREEVCTVLRQCGAALCAAESDELTSPELALTPGLRVYRMRRSAYTQHALRQRAAEFAAMAREGAQVYVFFKHEEAPDGPLRAAEVLAHIPVELRG